MGFDSNNKICECKKCIQRFLIIYEFRHTFERISTMNIPQIPLYSIPFLLAIENFVIKISASSTKRNKAFKTSKFLSSTRA